MNLGITEMLFIFVLALLIFGPRKLPELGRQLGRGLAEFRRASNEFKSQLEEEIRQLDVEETIGHTIAPPPPEGSIRRSPQPSPPGVTSETASPAGDKGADA